jgi:hypothetical protein
VRAARRDSALTDFVRSYEQLVRRARIIGAPGKRPLLRNVRSRRWGASRGRLSRKAGSVLG